MSPSLDVEVRAFSQTASSLPLMPRIAGDLRGVSREIYSSMTTVERRKGAYSTARLCEQSATCER